MTTYKIDVNRGNDSNNGISAPWQNLTKINTLVAVSGDNVLLASDSIFDIADNLIPAAGWTGSQSSPIIVGRYYPLSDSIGKPTIRRKRAVLAGDWTYDAPNNGWYMTFGFDVGFSAYVKLGGNWGLIYETALPLPSVALAWKNLSNGRVYVYAPAGTNPTAYYGSVYIASMYRNTFHFVDSGTYVIFEDIDSVEGGGLLGVYSDTGTRQYVMRRCDHRAVGTGVYQITDTAGRSGIEVYDCEFNGGIGCFINTYTPSNLGFGGINIHDCRFIDGCEGLAQGQVYLQARGAASLVWNNFCTGARYGTQFHTQDGVGIYGEVGVDQLYVMGNHIKDTYVGATDNTGRNAWWIGNLFENCYQAIKVEDFSDVGIGNHRFWNNTIVGAGNPALTYYGGVATGNTGWRAFEDNITVDIRNNVFKAHPQASSSLVAIHTGVSMPGAIANNAFFGFSSLATNYLGAASSITPTGTVSADPLLGTDYIPDAGSPLIGAGIKLAIPTKAFGCTWILKNPPDIGAMQTNMVRTVVAARVRMSMRSG